MYRQRLLVLATVIAAAGPITAAPKELPDRRPLVEVVFCLDTTGSMGGLIEGAKQKIWSISNQIVAGKPTPNLKVGLLAYRDRKDAYVTKLEPLTDDLDKIYATLKEFKAEGGGDTPESVNQALHESVTRFKWSEDKGTLKIVFLVGDAPPHMDYTDDVKFPETCKLAAEKGILINTIQCGSANDTAKFWQEISDKASGSYVQIAQDGAQVRVVTPYDKRLGEINAELENSTLVYGNKEKQERDRRFQAGAVDGAKAETTKDAKGEAKTTVVVTAPKAPEAKAGTILPAAPAGAGGSRGPGG
ncbi:MAG TPA: vWA domain-containing protein, partial [Gemmataceae bacterium]|nr:vWA domain-containing protein [Gemmataceae bacterium]